MTKCAIDGCTKPARKRGWCYQHYHKWHRYGDTAAPHGNRKRSLSIDEMAHLYRQGWTLAEIGEKAGIHGERVRQLLPEHVRREVKEARWQEGRERIAALIWQALDREEIADECGWTHVTAVSQAIRRYDLQAEWDAASVLRRERRTEENGPCRVCGSLVGEVKDAVTCGEELCEQVWYCRAMSARLDPEVRRKHRVRTARWNLENGEGTSRPEAYQRVVESDGRDVAAREGWFWEGSRSLALAAECVRRGYEPVIEALNDREMEQVRAYLSGHDAEVPA